ncbi:MAG: hypothetical protein HYZ42_05895, partial [Bacteroidetes bacterium]|nr:hypothetical protein [Bacteroidota bacterium]
INALSVVEQIIDKGLRLTDENFGEQLTRAEIYTYRNKTLSIDEFLENEKDKPPSNRGYLTVARDIRRFFELLNFIEVSEDKSAVMSDFADDLLNAESGDARKKLWKISMLQLKLEGKSGRLSHPYKILLSLVNQYPGIETAKLMLALEAEDDSTGELERIIQLIPLPINEIIQAIGTTESMAANAAHACVDWNKEQ